jgi:hypothetical protein
MEPEYGKIIPLKRIFLMRDNSPGHQILALLLSLFSRFSQKKLFFDPFLSEIIYAVPALWSEKVSGKISRNLAENFLPN